MENARWRMERWRMKDGGLRLEDRGWMEDGRWRMEDGRWMEDGGWRIEDGGWKMEDGGCWAAKMPGSKLQEPKHTLLLLEVLGELLGGAFWL